jgi:hypothetical protein
MPLSNTHASDDPRLIRYLIGSLEEDEAERLDELSITDDEFAARLQTVENDLVDAYVNGELSGETLERFKARYLSSPAGRDKVMFAEALLGHQQTPATQPARAAGSRGGFALPRLIPQWGWAVAALLFLGATGYLTVETNRLRRQTSDARAAATARERQLQRQLAEQQSANADTVTELTRARAALAQRTGTATANQPAAARVIASIVLLPPRRGAGELPAIAIPETQAVTLQVTLEADDFPIYRAELKDPATGHVVWRGSNLRADGGDRARSISITLDAGLLKPQTYTVEVTGVRARGASELIGSYPFRVAK